MPSRAKIVATIGPACEDRSTLAKLISSGVDVARLNFSHGTHDVHEDVIHRIRETCAELQRPICILQDLQGPKIRTGILEGGGVNLEANQPLTLTTRPIIGTSEIVSVDYPELPQAVIPGGRILLDDGNLELVVVSTSEDTVETRVVLSGMLKSNKGINLPGGRINLPSITEKDAEDIAFGLRQGVDAIALSFVRTAADIVGLRKRITELAPERPYVPIIAKLERPEALANLNEIMLETDGVMVARGDLGVEMPPEAVPLAQKRIIETANRCGKVVITATQMLDSMIHNPRPTRAEASDVANAIMDGTDAVMLSGETAAGGYPIKAVQMMDSIIKRTEKDGQEWFKWKGITQPDRDLDDTYYVTLAARELAQDRTVAAIAIFTTSGRTALLMSKTRPDIPIYAFTPREHSYHLMSMYWGVTPFLVPQVETIKEMIPVVDDVMTKSTPIRPGQQVIVICGFPVNRIRATNMVLLHTVGEFV